MGQVVSPGGSWILRGAWVLTMGPAGAVEGGAVRISDGRIAEVGTYPSIRRKFPNLPVIGDEFGIVIPGLINLHTHLSEALIPGMGSDLTLYEWGERLVTPVSRNLTAEMAREGTVLKAAEMVRSGVTCVNDMFVHSNPGSRASLGVVDGLAKVGLRGVVSFGAEDALGETTEVPPMSVGEVIEEQHDLSAATERTELVGFRYGIGTLLGQSDELLEAGAEMCRANSWGIHTHLCEVREEVVQASLRWGRRPIRQAAWLGLLDRPLVAAHVIWVTQPDIGLLAEAGTHVAHNPVANMILGAGVCPLARLRSAGIGVGIGTDGAASNDSQNMLEAVKMAALLQKVNALDPAVVTAQEVLEMATVGGARALGMEDRVGRISPGLRADLVHIRPTVELAAIHDPYQQVVYCVSPRSVSDVWVDGRRLLADGELVTIDEAAQIAEARRLAGRIASRAGISGTMSRL